MYSKAAVTARQVINCAAPFRQNRDAPAILCPGVDQSRSGRCYLFASVGSDGLAPAQ
jgi:hypothetical protein